MVRLRVSTSKSTSYPSTSSFRVRRLLVVSLWPRGPPGAPLTSDAIARMRSRIRWKVPVGMVPTLFQAWEETST